MADARPPKRPRQDRVVIVTGAAKGLGQAITTMTERVRSDVGSDLLTRRMWQIPLGRGEEPHEAAGAVSFLIDAGFATGSELVLDGGLTVFADT